MAIRALVGQLPGTAVVLPLLNGTIATARLFHSFATCREATIFLVGTGVPSKRNDRVVLAKFCFAAWQKRTKTKRRGNLAPTESEGPRHWAAIATRELPIEGSVR